MFFGKTSSLFTVFDVALRIKKNRLLDVFLFRLQL